MPEPGAAFRLERELSCGQDLPQSDPRFQARQRRADAEVKAGAESQNPVRRPVDIEAIGLREDSRVAMRRSDEQKQSLARLDRLARDLEV